MDVLDDVCVVDTLLPPVKVYILTGQSNNRGQGSILHGDPDTNRRDLNTLIADEMTSPLYTEYGFSYSHLVLVRLTLDFLQQIIPLQSGMMFSYIIIMIMVLSQVESIAAGRYLDG